MPRFEINGPDGRRFEIDGPDGSTLEQAIEYTKQTYYGAQQAAPEDTAPAPIAPTVAQPKISTTFPPEDEGFFARNLRYAKDALTSGIESFQAGIKGEVMATDAAIIQGIEKKYGPGAKDAPPDVKEEYSKSVQSYLAAQRAREDIQKQAQTREQVSPLRPETAKLKAAMQPDVAFMESASQAWDALKANPVGVITDIGIESLPASLYMVASAAIARLGLKTPTAAPVAGGFASMANEFGNEYAERIAAGESHDDAWKNASIKSGVIGVFDAVSLGSAGKAAGEIVDKLTKKGAIAKVSKEVAKETSKQAGYGAAGEAVGSLAVGEIPNPAAVMAEAVGEVFGAPMEAAVGYRTAKKTKEDQLISNLDASFEDNVKVEPTVEAKDERGLPISEVPSEDVTRRIEPSLFVPSGREKAVAAAQPEKIEPSGLGAPSVPTEGAGARTEPTLAALEKIPAAAPAAPTPTLTPLGRLFEPSDTVSPQQKRTNIHYNALMTDPKNPVTQSLIGLDTSIQKAKDAYTDIAAKLNIPSSEDMMGLGVRLPKPISDLLNYPSATGSAVRLVTASKELTSGAKRGTPNKVESARRDVNLEANRVDQIIADAYKAAEDPQVQAKVNALIEQNVVNKNVAARQAEIAAVPMEQRADKIKSIEDEIRAKLKPKEAPSVPSVPSVPSSEGNDYFAPEAFEKVDQGYKSRSTIIQMSPDDFLRMAEPGLSERHLKNVKEVVESGTKLDTVPALITQEDPKTGTAKVIGSDGRHRATILKEKGVTSMPVELRGMIRWDQQNDPENFDYWKGKWPTTLKAEKSDETMPYPVARPTPTTKPTTEAVTKPEEVKLALAALPEGMNDAQFLDAATKLRAGKVMQVKLPILRSLKDSGLVLADNSLSPEGEQVLDQLAAAKPSELRKVVPTKEGIEEKLISQAMKAGKMAQPVVEQVAADSLSGALRALAARTTNSFYKDLLEVLANLNMPTSIVLDGERDLTRRYIDLKTAKQQNRLFKYVEVTYPDVYDKYFRNYDREDNLEKVHDGLNILKQPRFKLGPVAAEFSDVSELFDHAMQGLRVPGAYYPAFDTITLNSENATNDTLIHEALHAATEAILEADPDTLTPGQREAVAEIKAMYKYATEKIPLDLYGLQDVHEFISELYTNKNFRERLKQIPYQSTRVPIFTRLVRVIFKAIGMDNLAGAAMAEATKIFSAVRPRTKIGTAPRFAPKGKRVRGPISTTWRSVEQTYSGLGKTFKDAINGRQSWDSMLPQILPAMWDASTTLFRRGILGFANLRQIDDLTKTKFPQISGAIRIIEQMIADRNRKMNEAKDILQRWTKAQSKNLGQSRLMGRIMLEATIRGIDPDTAKAGTLNKPMQDAWDGLDPEFKQIYREVRNFYSRSINEMINEMKKRALQLPKAERQQVLKNINEKFGKDKLVSPYFPLRRFGKYWFQVGTGNFKEFYEFENPLARELAFRKRQTELAAGNQQQRALVDTMRKGNGISELYSQNLSTTQVLKDAQDIIDNVTATNVADVKKELKESLDQLIYILLPQQSVRKMFINRKSIQGASEDMLRVFATTAVHTAYQQSRFKYAEKFVNNLMTARDYVKELPNSDVYNDYIQEVEKRVPTILSNEDTSLGAVVAGKVSDATFYWMLSAPFSAMLNTLGMAQITMPYIAGRYGYAKTNAMMLQNLGRYFVTMPKRTIAPGLKGNIMQMQFPSIVEGGNLSPLLERAAQRFIADNDINISQTNDIMDIGGRPSELYTGRYNTIKRTIAGLFHQSERLNREVTLMTVFELAYDKYLNEPKKDLRGIVQRDAAGDPIPNTPDDAFELAITEAKDIAGLSLGDFTRQMKPRYFTPPLPSVLFKFKQYSVLATYVIARNFYYTFAAPFRKGELTELRRQMTEDGVDEDVIEQRIAEADLQRKETYKEGRRRLAGILGVTFLLGGAEAMPFFTIGLGTLVKMLAGDDDDEFFDWENWFRNYCETELGGYFADMLKKMGMDEAKASKTGKKAGEAVSRGPVAVTTGGSLADRVSLDPVDLWFRDARFSSDTRENVVNTIIANAGPAVGLTVNVAEAVELMEQGQYQRAFEKMAPAIVAKPAAAYRLSEEGARTKSGIKLADNFSAWELAMQSIGLQPERLAQAQKAAIEAKTAQEKIKDQRATILNRLWLERNNAEGFNDAIERAIEFSKKYPELQIDGKVVTESFKKRAKNQAEAEVVGAQIDKKLRPRLMPMTEYGKE